MEDDIFELLELANKLEESETDRIEAATKYYEAVYLMRRYIARLPETDEGMKKRELLGERATFYEKRASMILSVDGVRGPNSPNSTDSGFFNEDSGTIAPPAASPLAAPSLTSTDSEFIVSRASEANNKLACALDEDEAGRTQKAISLYLEVADLFLQVIKRGEELSSSPSSGVRQVEPVLDAARRRLTQTLDRIEVLKSGKKTIVPPDKTTSSGRGHLTAEEIAVLKRSSMIASRLFLPWSDLDAVRLLESASNPKFLFKDPDGFLPLNEKQKARFEKWARPSEIVKLRKQSGYTRSTQQIVMMKGSPSPYTIRQQFVTDCSFICALICAASYERRTGNRLVTKMLYPQRDGMPFVNPEGKYMVKLWLNGVARSVVVGEFSFFMAVLALLFDSRVLALSHSAGSERRLFSDRQVRECTVFGIKCEYFGLF